VNIANLAQLFSDFFDAYYPAVQTSIATGRIRVPWRSTVLYPTLLLVTDAGDHWIVELVGAAQEYLSLTVKRHSADSVNHYVSQLGVDTSIGHLHLDTAFMVLEGLAICDATDLDTITQRFPAVATYRSRYKLVRRAGAGSLVSFGPVVRFITFVDVLFLHHIPPAYRVKHARYLAVLAKDITTSEILEHLARVFREEGNVEGVIIANAARTKRQIVAGQLQNLFLQPDLRETTLGEFFRRHTEVLLQALGGTHLIYEPTLDWRVPSAAGDDTAINPDAFLRRTDGYCDVVDFKTAALLKASLTRGPRKRRRFIDYASEGIAQLAHYRDYLSYAPNLQHAREKYGAEFKDPRFTLIVGHFENAFRERMEEAARSVKGIEVIDYDSLVQLFLTSSDLLATI
jgi:hypothetical protein